MVQPASRRLITEAALAEKAQGVALTTQNLNDLREPVTYYQVSNADATAERNYPVPGMSCTIVNLPVIPGIFRFTQLAVLNHWIGAAMYVRSFNGTAWSPWATYMTQSSSDSRYYQKTVLDPILASIGNAAPADAAEHDYRLSALRARRGPVKVTTPGAVVLAFDHGLTKFKSIVMPMLAARNLPVTLAVNSQMMDDPTNSGATTADLASWASGSLVEIANHGRTHTFSSSLETEIRGGREELEAIIGQSIDTYIQAGITNDTWGGSFADVAGTARGRISYSAHAILAGVMPSSTLLYPLDGNPSPGAKGSWIDNGGAQITAARSRVTAAVAANAFTIIRLHPEHIDGSGRITTAELAAFLDWLVAERNANRITVLQLRDASIAGRSTYAIDQTAGRVVKIWDYLNGREQITYGDTGWRAIDIKSTTLAAGRAGTGTLQMRRMGNQVSCRIRDFGLTDGAGSALVLHANEIPSGFRPNPYGTTFTVSRVEAGTGTATLKLASSLYWIYQTDPVAGVKGSRAASAVQGEFTYTTDDVWPAALPGTPA